MSGIGDIISFFALSILAVVAALLVMAARSIIHAVLFLILFFFALAALFVLLTADFVAVAQVLVYAGAIAVLIIFAIMLTPARERTSMETNWIGPGLLTGGVVAGTVIVVAFLTSWQTRGGNGFPSTVGLIGSALVNLWALPFEIASVLLLAAMVGAIVLVRGREVDQARDTGELSETEQPPAVTLPRRER